MIKQSTIYSSNVLLVFNCEYRLRSSLRGRPTKRPTGAGHVQRLIIITRAAGLRVRGMSSLGQTLARHLLTCKRWHHERLHR